MSDKRALEVGAVSFSERLASSQVFATLFRDGMALVEETASYLDGTGRSESKKLERSASLVYATESMRLTTRLMQLASWLLLHRAVKEGEMTLAQAHKEKSKVRLAACEPGDAKSLELLPEKLQELIARSTRLQTEVRRLDATMHALPDLSVPVDNPVERQMGLLKAAFEFLLESRQTAAAVHQMLLAAGPGWVRLRIDVEMQRIARLTPGRAGGEF